ncbi:ParB family protein [Arthrobacter bambusae]
MSKAKPESFSPYFATVDAGQVRAAFAAAGHLEGYASISELIEAATLKEVRRLQRRHNNGKPWEPLPPGSARTGRRSKEEARHAITRGA